MRIYITIIAALWAVMSTSALAAGENKLSLYTVNYPLHYFAVRIAGENADAVFPASADVDPAFWQPPVETIAEFQQADLILLNGAGYAKWLERVSLPRRKLVDTSSAFQDRYIHVQEGATHSHGPGGDHSHTETAFTTWLDFNQAAEQAQAIAAAMMRKRPQWKDDFAKNLAALEADLLVLDQQIKTLVAGQTDQPLLASHPVYQYFQRRYALNLVSVMWEPDEVPNETLWAGLEQTLKGHPASWMLWEGEPNPQNVQRLRSMGVESIVFNPAGNRPHEGDFLSVMQDNVHNLQRVFQ
jgi:zinc transport system substrate-binding protein